MNLKEIRTKKGYKQGYVAQMVGIDRASYTNIENGKRRPSVEIAQAIGKVLGIPWASIFEEEPETEVHDGEE